ncbi:class I SAM-dependent methyltransferase [Prolixibacter denitrificans]|uniref:Ubiquinone/menaquinone biosynthesis C-methylase UbiE n=1 Tax=Prolixibacter denitrificans TaxID=1541063 RepID=A0A2P8C6I4_9BACT|nr:class I SAM-dependent methyltransferase [Prolixibacter denitrificans]PSK80588.1 ubiquinone/menaquinone biosynthesis C-methylase UbiE [Prolixibacter denitrificans]GET22118.1 hypothetical protein JCM18694_23640 [Prolixibacter denitrificans]
MTITDILAKAQMPSLYEKGSAVMWTDPYISKQVLQIHLNEEIDLGSRKKSTILQTVDWMLKQSEKKSLNILDLGCGPGLYAEQLANKGHKVTGVDFSENSIAYAREEAHRKQLNITYLQADYTALELEANQFDLVILIYTDFGVLLPDDREKLLNLVHRVLKPDGKFIFDVLNDNEPEKKPTPKTWDASAGGFWKPEPYLVLSESFLYPEEKVILYQHIVVDEQDKSDVYRFWTHLFSHSDLSGMLSKHGFQSISFHENVLPGNDPWSGENVTFCQAIKV